MRGSSIKIAVLLIAIVTILLNPVLLSYGGTFQEKTYKLVGDGYIQGRAKITCWEYGDGPKIYIKIDVVKAVHMKGNNLMSAFIVDVTKNGANSYIEIGHAVAPREKSDYIAFKGDFDSSDFPATAKNDPCPIGDAGRIVVVIGKSQPSDNDTLSKGTVDIISASTDGTAKKGIL